MSSSPNFWIVIPAAGVGKRMGSDIPKQYLSLNGKTVLQHSIERTGRHERVSGVVVALGISDTFWKDGAINIGKPLYTVDGGNERCHSVLNALYELSTYARDDDWVLVHDAARPCLRNEDLEKLINELADHPVGGLLAVPVRDTMKRSDDSRNVTETVDRNHLWHALTPQMFRLNMLRNALHDALNGNQLVTDEASAMELAGYSPKLVEGHADNIKITRPEDLALAEFFLQQQEH